MATYTSTTYDNETSGKQTAPASGLANNSMTLLEKVHLDTSAALNDLLNFFYVPPGFEVHSASIISDDLDSNGSPAITLDLGDADGATTLFSASTIAQTGGIDSNMVRTALKKVYSVKTLIQGKVHAAGATKVAGDVWVRMTGRIVGNATS